MPLCLTIENYKSIRRTELNLRPGLSVLVGPNGSGKTCLLSSLKFIRDVFRVGAAQALARQGGARRVYRHGQSEMSFSFIQSYGERTYRRQKIPCTIAWQMTLSQAGREFIATIVRETSEITGLHDNKPVRLFSHSVDRTDPEKPQIKQFLCSPAEFGRDLFSQWQDEYSNKNKRQIYESFTARDPSGRESKRIRSSLGSEPDRLYFPTLSSLDKVTTDIYLSFLVLNQYNIIPDLARASTEQLPFAQMLPNGAAVSEVIDALENKRYHKLEQVDLMEMEDGYGYSSPFYMRRYYFPYDTRMYRIGRGRSRESIEQALQNINTELAAAVRGITAVSVSLDPTNGKRFVVFESDDDTFYPEEVSDGTIKWLCILVSLFVPFSRVYLLEEPENYLHPWMQQRLIEIMREQSKQHNTICFVSSHSATIINSAYPDEILIVNYREDGTEVSQVRDVEDVKDVLAKSDLHLGDLWVSGAIGGVPADE